MAFKGLVLNLPFCFFIFCLALYILVILHCWLTSLVIFIICLIFMCLLLLLLLPGCPSQIPSLDSLFCCCCGKNTWRETCPQQIFECALSLTPGTALYSRCLERPHLAEPEHSTCWITAPHFPIPSSTWQALFYSLLPWVSLF